MITKITKTTTREYDKDGKLVKEVITEITENEVADKHSPLTYPNIVYTGDPTGTSTYYSQVTCEGKTNGGCSSCSKK